ncbi:MAG: hypothetical protein IT305_02340 [Chloroflexi bacterium]|nr:hypothetical protein [Chloroflexota bacterium]
MEDSTRRDAARSSAFFLGAFGTTLGLLGAPLAGLGIVAARRPDLAGTIPDWVFTVLVVGMLTSIVGAWPVLDWLVNHRPALGGVVLVVLGGLLVGIGALSIRDTAWGVAGWLAVAGGLMLLPAAWLAAVGGGTEPLTWVSLRTTRVRAVEERLDVLVGWGTSMVVVAGALVGVFTDAVFGLAVAVVAGAAVTWWALSRGRE